MPRIPPSYAIVALWLSLTIPSTSRAQSVAVDAVQSAYPPALRGEDTCSPGSPDCNVCMRRVPSTFERLETRSSSRDTVRAKIVKRTLHRRFGLRHYQSVVSFAASDGSEFLALSRSARRKGRGRIEFVRLPPKGEKTTLFPRLNRFGPGRLERAIRVPGGNHPGGMQVVGNVLVVAVECEKRRGCKQPARILFYDVSNPSKTSKPFNELVLDGSRGEPRQGRTSKASAVAVTKLVDGRFLLFVGGRHSGRYGHFYVSEGSRLDEGTRFRFAHYWSAVRGDPSQGFDPLLGECSAREGGVCKEWDRYENLNFVTECGTGRIYLVGMGEKSGKVVLHRLRAREGVLDFQAVARKKVSTARTSLGVSLRNGGGIRVRSDGSGFDLYVADRAPRREGRLKLYRYGSADPPRR